MSLASSESPRAGKTGAPIPEPLLDVDQAVVIAATFGDGILCLDYRDNWDHPAVGVSDWSSGKSRWRTIAGDIEELYLKLDL